MPTETDKIVEGICILLRDLPLSVKQYSLIERQLMDSRQLHQGKAAR